MNSDLGNIRVSVGIDSGQAKAAGEAMGDSAAAKIARQGRMAGGGGATPSGGGGSSFIPMAGGAALAGVASLGALSLLTGVASTLQRFDEKVKQAASELAPFSAALSSVQAQSRINDINLRTQRAAIAGPDIAASRLRSMEIQQANVQLRANIDRFNAGVGSIWQRLVSVYGFLVSPAADLMGSGSARDRLVESLSDVAQEQLAEMKKQGRSQDQINRFIMRELRRTMNERVLAPIGALSGGAIGARDLVGSP